MQKILKATTFNPKNFTFSDVKTDAHGRKIVYVNNDRNKVVIQTPKMYLPNGIKRWRKKDASDNKDDSFEIELSLPLLEKRNQNSEQENQNSNQLKDRNALEIDAFHMALQEYDDIVKQMIVEKSKEWIGKPKVSQEVVEEAYYTPSVKVATDKDGTVLNYASRLKVKLDRDRDQETDTFSGKFLAYKRPKTFLEMYNEAKEKLDLNETTFETVLPKGSKAIFIIELVYISITTKVSTKWKVIQGKCFTTAQNIQGYAIDDDTDLSDAEGTPEDLDQADTPETPALAPVLPDPESEAEADLDPEPDLDNLDQLSVSAEPQQIEKKMGKTPRTKKNTNSADTACAL